MSNETTVFLVVANYDYQGSSAVRAFLDKKAAEAFAALCHEYGQKKPEAPPVEDTPENDAEHETWLGKDEEWRKGHPAGEDHSSADSFLVMEIPLVVNAENGPTEKDGRWAW